MGDCLCAGIAAFQAPDNHKRPSHSNGGAQPSPAKYPPPAPPPNRADDESVSNMADMDGMPEGEDFGAAAAPKKRTAPAAAAGQSDVNVVQESEKVLEKLKLLDYEREFCIARNFKPLARTFFALSSSNPNEQFFYFTSLVSWLLGLQGRDF